MRALLPLLAIALVLPACGQQQDVANNDAADDAIGIPVKGVDRGQKGQPAPDAKFLDPDGGEISLADFKGTPVLVNLWATWCAPCVKELPTINEIAREHDKDGTLGVIAVSQDMGEQGSVEAFLAKLKVDDLGAYHDPKMALSGALNAQVLPTTILYDADGKEVWRYVGDLDWTSDEARKLLAEVPAAGKG
ncbi:TlpA family protein disulfide reductase [Sphingomonas daechungensis]|uniref:TlpA family protein disulfide reductase n=1 Tax=Sphingomonas daechungensis TaxID=1176646 RepID=UPI0037841E71